MADLARLPRRFPVGTRYVLEGIPAPEGQLQVISRLIVLPNGQQFDLTHEAPELHRRQAGRLPHAGRSQARRAKH